MSVELRRGEIINVGQIIEPERATILGNNVRSLFEKYVNLPLAHYKESGPFMFDDSDLAVSALRTNGLCKEELTNSFWIGQSDRSVVEDALTKFRDLLDDKGVDEHFAIDAEFFVGTAGSASWHFDPSKEYRLLVNLTDNDLKLHVANDPVPDDYEVHWDGETRFKPEGPEVYDTLEYGSGEGLLLDNMCEPLERVPHAGVIIPQKVFLRAYAVPPV